jgi:aryl-alcohol dehydrogenase-like predicted oxidoreductase
MQYETLAGLDQPVARLVMGTMVCTTDNQDLTNELLDAYVAAGGNCLDTARVYGGGKTETALGNWFTSRGNRSEILLLGKGAHPDSTGKRVRPDTIAQDIQTSLELMQTDYMDIYLLHRDDPEVPVGEIVDCLNAHREAGRIRVFGGSNWTIERLQAANDYAAAKGVQGFSANSPYFGLAIQNEPMWGGCLALDAEGLAWHTETQMALFPWSSQAGGFFTDRYAPDILSNADMVRVYYNEENWARKARATQLAKEKEATANQVALAYVLHQAFPVFPLFGPRTLDELASSLPALDISLTPDEIRWLETGRQ